MRSMVEGACGKVRPLPKPPLYLDGVVVVLLEASMRLGRLAASQGAAVVSPDPPQVMQPGRSQGSRAAVTYNRTVA